MFSVVLTSLAKDEQNKRRANENSKPIKCKIPTPFPMKLMTQYSRIRIVSTAFSMQIPNRKGAEKTAQSQE